MSEWKWTNDPKAPCSYCVQWRAVGPADEYDGEHEPYWPDGSVVPLVRREACRSCEEAIEAYIADHENEGVL